MWIKMKKTYVGPMGCFPKDWVVDVPDSVIKKLPKRSFKRCNAPWERKVKNASKTKTKNDDNSKRQAIETGQAKG